MIPDVTPNGVFYLPPTGWLTSFYNPPLENSSQTINYVDADNKVISSTNISGHIKGTKLPFTPQFPAGWVASDQLVTQLMHRRNNIPRKSLNYRTPLEVFMSYVTEEQLSTFF